MDYPEAADIARKNPGAVLTRDASGAFIVRLTNGTVLGSSVSAVDDFYREVQELRQELSRLHADYESRKEQFNVQIVTLKETNSKLNDSAAALKLEATQRSQTLESLRAENVAFKSKLAKVSAEEWQRIEESDRIESERIKESDRIHRERDVAIRKSDRKTIKCPCSGEVETCARCFGTGEYTTDGFGNPI